MPALTKFLAVLAMGFLSSVLGRPHHDHKHAHKVVRKDVAEAFMGDAPEVTGAASHGHIPHHGGTPVFFHYLIGTLDDDHARLDIECAKATGMDAFSLNIASVEADWAVNATRSLFKWAQVYDFKLFFSFDMDYFSDPAQFTNFLQKYTSLSTYYRYHGKPLVSSYNGGNSRFAQGNLTVNALWQRNLKDVMQRNGTSISLQPAWPDIIPSTSVFSDFPVLDGAMQWNSWPYASQGPVVVGTADDRTYQIAAQKSGRKFRMGASPLQYKHQDASNNYYLRGNGNFNVRVGQILQMQPDMVEFQSWNDVGEGHNMGLAWPEGISCCASLQAYNIDHSAFLEIMPTYIKAIKSGATTTDAMYPSNGQAVQGIFYYHQLLAAGDCSSDSLGKPRGSELVEDVVINMIYVAPWARKLRLKVFSAGVQVGETDLNAGYNSYTAYNITAGSVVVHVVDQRNKVVYAAKGPADVLASSSICNYNIQVGALQAYTGSGSPYLNSTTSTSTSTTTSRATSTSASTTTMTSESATSSSSTGASSASTATRPTSSSTTAGHTAISSPSTTAMPMTTVASTTSSTHGGPPPPPPTGYPTGPGQPHGPPGPGHGVPGGPGAGGPWPGGPGDGGPGSGGPGAGGPGAGGPWPDGPRAGGPRK